MFKFIYTLILALSFLTSLFAMEMSVEVEEVFQDGVNQKDKDQRLINIGLQKVLIEYLKSKNLEPGPFLNKIQEKYNDEDEKSAFFKSFFIKYQLSRPGFERPQELNLAQNGTVATEFDAQKITEKYYEFVLSFEDLKQKNLYLTLNLELSDTTKWDDLGVNSKEQFSSSIANSWKENYGKTLDQFQNILLTDTEWQNKLENFSKRFNPEAFEIKYFLNYKKVSENKILKKTKFEISAHLIVLKIQSRETVYTFEFPTQKKEFSSTNKNDLSSTLATIGHNFLASKLAAISEKLNQNKTIVDMEYLLTGKFLFSDISAAREILSNYFKDLNIEVSTANMSLTNAKFLIKIPTERQSEYLERLSKLGRRALSDNKNEQKFLIFDSNNNSFAIVTNN